MAWNPNSSTNVVGYNLYYGPASASYTNFVSAGDLTNATVYGLSPGVTYYFAVTAYDDSGLESLFSAEVAYTVPSAASSNQPPTLAALPNMVLPENAAAQTVNLTGITSGASNEIQTLTVTASSSNPGLVPAPSVAYSSPNTTGTLTFTPAALASGTATITVIVNDGGASNNITSQSFTVTVLPVNQPPTLAALPNVVLPENAAAQTVNLTGITSGASNEIQTLTVTASSSNPGLVPAPSVAYSSPNTTGTLTFTPVALASGTATITVTVNDGGASNNITSQSFTVTVLPVNQPPTLAALPNVVLPENAAAQTVNLTGITSGASNEVQTLTVTASSSNPGLVPGPSVAYSSPNTTGTLTFTPAALTSGTATITVTVNDGGASNNLVARSFTVIVDQPPSISTITDKDLPINSQGFPIPFTVGDADTPATNLILTASSTNATLVPISNLVFSGDGTNRTITITPAPNQVGSSQITVSVSDGISESATSFHLTVEQQPAPPDGLRIRTN